MAKSGNRITLLQALADLHSSEERDKLYAWIMCGEIRVDGEVIKDPKRLIQKNQNITRKSKVFVSRGGDKLESVLPHFIREFPQLEPLGAWILDAGSSTGGFVDALLQRGAAGIYAVDVGYNQLDYKLRTDSRVRVMEQTNALDVRGDALDPRPKFCTADLSFRSIQGIGKHLCGLGTSGLALVLIKPQFERQGVQDISGNFDGIVSEEELPIILENVRIRLLEEGVRIKKMLPSGLRGTQGNQEFFAVIEDFCP